MAPLPSSSSLLAKFHRNFDEIFARQSAGTRGGREYCSVGDKPGGGGEPVAI